MLTNGEHDSMWKNVMGTQIPISVECLNEIQAQLHYSNMLKVLEDLKAVGDILPYDVYVENLIGLGVFTGLYKKDGETLKNIENSFKEKFGREIKWDG